MVIEGETVDESATETLRAKLRSSEGAATHFNFGPEREEYERYWTPEAYDAMTEIMASLPNHWRFFVKARIFDAMNASEIGGVEVVHSAFAGIAAEHPQIGSLVK